MIKRAVVLEIEADSNGLYNFVKIFLMMNRVYFPILLASVVLSYMLFLRLNIKTYEVLNIILIMEILYTSISCHECIHISFAKLLGYKSDFVSFVPQNFGATTHFNRNIKIWDIDKAGILLSAPIILTLLGFLAMGISVIGSLGLKSIIFIIAFLSINILSLIPNSKCDGGRAYKIFKSTGKKSIYLCMSSILVYIIWSLGFKNLPIVENLNLKSYEGVNKRKNGEK